MYVFDIETGPLENGESIRPFDPGRLVDKEKIAKAQEEHFGKLALKPTTGEVLAIGYGLCDPQNWNQIAVISQNDMPEEKLLKQFWDFFESGVHAQNHDLFGFNCHKFDLPFLIGRSRIRNVKIPSTVLNGRYWHPHLKDLATSWVCHVYGEFIKLEELSLAMGFGPKPEEEGGKNFYLLFRDDPGRAMHYARWDILTTARIANRFVETGVF